MWIERKKSAALCEARTHDCANNKPQGDTGRTMHKPPTFTFHSKLWLNLIHQAPCDIYMIRRGEMQHLNQSVTFLTKLERALLVGRSSLYR